MRIKVLWIFTSFAVALSLILTSCGTESTETTETDKTTVVSGTVVETSTTPEVARPSETTYEEKPKYGGVSVIALSVDIAGFDEAFISHTGTYSLKLTNEELVQGDWTKGGAGTGEATWVLGSISGLNLKNGALAESWEIPERGKIIFHIRKGVYWHNKPPTNGRELTVDDVVFSLKRMCTAPGAYIKMSFPGLASSMVVTGDDAAGTVTVQCPVEQWPDMVVLVPDFLAIMPRDAIEYYGDLNNWRNSIGTGPFILTDFVSNGSATFIRNDNYWETNPIGPGKGDRLPYLEGVRFLIITDTSTRMAAFRTAKIDSVSGEYDDTKEFLNNPDIKHISYVNDSGYIIAMRQDKADSPFSKKEVRQALTMAIDFDQIVNEYYGGKALMLSWPISYSKENSAAYVPIEKLPTNVQELYSHNVGKAKELLTAGGYPTGFSTKVFAYNTPNFVDYLSIIKNMWAEIGVNLTIDAREYAVWVGRLRARNYDEMFYMYTSGAWQRMQNFYGNGFYNTSYINDPRVAEEYAKVTNYIGVDEGKIAEIYRELVPYLLEKCYVIPKPTPYTYVVWWPWRKNWNGEIYVGYYSIYTYHKYIWQDGELKKEMTGR